MKHTGLGPGVFALIAGFALSAQAQTAAEVLDTYADIAAAKYQDSLTAARALQDAVAALVAAPSPETLQAARTAWIAARVSYLGVDGTLIDQIRPPPDLRQGSIRHLAVRADGLVAFAMQWEGDPGDPVPLLGLHRRGAAPRFATAPEAEQALMQGYAGSVALDGTGGEVAITSPRGGRLHRFAPDGRFLGAVARADVCGLAPHAQGLIASDGRGGLIAVTAGGPRPLATAPVAWDNHIVDLRA